MKIRLRNALIAVSMGMALVNVPYRLQADNTEFCSKEVLLAYFPENFVQETLKNFKVPEDQRDAIVKELSSKEKNVIKLVDEKAAKLNPNPLKERTPESRHETVRIFRETISEIFSGVLKDHGITDEKQIQSMLADIQQQKAKNFAKCMEKQRALFDKEKSAPSSTEPTKNSSDDSSSSQNKYNFLSDDSDEDKNQEDTQNGTKNPSDDDSSPSQNKYNFVADDSDEDKNQENTKKGTDSEEGQDDNNNDKSKSDED